MPGVQLDEGEFKRRFLSQYSDPAFRPLQAELDRIAQVAWEAMTAVASRVRNAARTLLEAVQARRAGRLVSAGNGVEQPRQK